MKERNKDKILTFRELYDSLHFNMIECGDGWFDLIYTLSADIMHLCHKNNVEKYPHLGECPRVVQVKEKFGGLRYYIVNVKDAEIAAEIDQLIGVACERSFKICEQCGESACQDWTRVTKSSWQRTLCVPCWKLYDKRL